LSVQGGADVELVDATVSTTHGPAVTVVRARVRVRGGDFSGDRMPGVEVGERGVAELDRVSLRGFTTGLIWRAGASGTADRCTVTGTSGDAVLVQTDEPVTLTGCTLSDHDGQGVRVGPGGGRLQLVDLRTGEDGRSDDAPPRAVGEHERAPRRGRTSSPAGTVDADGATGGDNPDPPGSGELGSISRLPARRRGRLHQMLAQLDALIGLEEVKREVATLVRLHQMAERRSLAGLPAPPLSRHLVFTGSPGTGKTTVARLYGKILAELGVIAGGQLIETGRPDLVASVVGGTALKTTERFNEALGGVLSSTRHTRWRRRAAVVPTSAGRPSTHWSS